MMYATASPVDQESLMPRRSRPLLTLGLAAAILVAGCSAATTSGGTTASILRRRQPRRSR